MRGRRANVRGEEGDVERVVLWRCQSVEHGDEVDETESFTCLPIMPMQAIDGVVMMGT